MSAKKSSTAPKAKKSKAAKEAKPEDGKQAEPKAEEAKPAELRAAEEAKGAAKTSKAKKTKADAKPKKLSAIDAAAKVLSEVGEPMNCQDIIKAMAEKGYWTSPGGKTPAATLYSAILRELQTKGNEARFKKTERGKFAVGKMS
jgi:HB1, ASXL, restriction endonuclease HTH domain